MYEVLKKIQEAKKLLLEQLEVKLARLIKDVDALYETIKEKVKGEKTLK